MTINEQVSHLVHGVESTIWRLELAKYAAQTLAISRAQRWEMVAPNIGTIFFQIARLVVAGIVGASVHIWYLLRTAPARSTQRRLIVRLKNEQEKRTFIALHGELSNRTRHLLSPNFQSGNRPVYLVLGRCGMAASEIDNIFNSRSHRSRKHVVHPISFSAFTRSWHRLFQLTKEGHSALSQTPIRLPLRELCAIMFRIVNGATQSTWWSSSGFSPTHVFFGHTGLADSSQLEQAMQQNGTLTIHVVHGVSHGWNFAGISDVGLFNSRHDARLAKQLSGYGKCISLPHPAPANRNKRNRSPKFWLLLTSYSHPMNPEFRKNGIAADLAAMERVRVLASQVSRTPKSIFWRPHPIFDSLLNEAKQNLTDAATEANFRPLLKNESRLEIDRYGLVFTTPSTVALDTLRAGMNPIVLATAPLEDDHVYSKMSMLDKARPCDLDKLTSAQEINRIWRAIMPTSPLTHEDQIKDIIENVDHTVKTTVAQ